MILIIGFKGDNRVDCISKHLIQRGVPFSLYTFSQFPKSSSASIFLNKDDVDIRINTAQGTISLKDVHAIWFSCFEAPDVHDDISPAFREYALEEAKSFVENLTLIPVKEDVIWLSDYYAMQKANHKPYQLYIANKIGFKTARTYIGNDADAALSYFQDDTLLALKPLHRARMYTDLSLIQKIVKAILDGIQWLTDFFKKNTESSEVAEVRPEIPNDFKNLYAVPTKQITYRDLQNAHNSLKHCPVILQQYIPKKLELRITVVGEKVFPCAIYSQESDGYGKIDFRNESLSLRHAIYELPATIEKQCITLLKELGLRYGAIDMIVTPNDEYIFLEINADGQWLWIEDKTGMPIAEAIADLLITQDGLDSASEDSDLLLTR